MTRKPHAQPERPVNVWIGLLGLIAFALVTVPFLWAVVVLLLAMQP